MGNVRIEVVRMQNRHKSYPGLIARDNPNPLEVITMTSSTTASLSTAVADQVGIYDMWARVKNDEACLVGLGSGGSVDGYSLVANEWSPWIPVRGGEQFEVDDAA